jgi:tetratricopeptide (TPR) repeat protein
MAEVLAGTPGVRDPLRQLLQGALRRGDAEAASRTSTVLLLHTLADFSDFRGLGDALAAFDAAPPGPAYRLRADAVLLGRASLDHRHDHGEAGLVPVRARLFEALRDGAGLMPDERMLLAKVLVDHDSMRNDLTACARVLALMQDVVPSASLRWQATWWRLASETHDYTGDTTLAQAASDRLQALLPRLDEPELTMALACEDMRAALHADDRVRAERAFRVIEQQRPRVRPALLPRGLRAQVSLLLRRQDYRSALERTRLMLDLCEDHEVPERDRAGYIEQQAHVLTGLGRHDEAVALLESLRATQVGGQADVLEAIIAMARAVQALEGGADAAREAALAAIRLAAPLQFHRFLMSFPEQAARIAAIGMEAGVETEFLARAVRERRLAPPQPGREDWPWALHVNAFGGLRVRRDGAQLGGQAGKAQKKPLELLSLLAAHPGGLDGTELVDLLWPSLEADAPKASLEMAIARLRKWLGAAEAVRVADGRVALHPGLVWSDVADFEAACLAGDAERALALYRAPLLPAESRVADRRRALAARLAAVGLDAAASLRARGRHAEALALLGRALAAEPDAAALQAALRV